MLCMNTSHKIKLKCKKLFNNKLFNVLNTGRCLSHIHSIGRHAIAPHRQGGAWSFDRFANANGFWKMLFNCKSRYYK